MYVDVYVCSIMYVYVCICIDICMCACMCVSVCAYVHGHLRHPKRLYIRNEVVEGHIMWLRVEPRPMRLDS